MNPKMRYVRVLLVLLVTGPILVYIQLAPTYPDTGSYSTMDQRTKCKPGGGGRVDIPEEVSIFYLLLQLNPSLYKWEN